MTEYTILILNLWEEICRLNPSEFENFGPHVMFGYSGLGGVK